MVRAKITLVGAVILSVLATIVVVGCGSPGSSHSRSITYWAINMAPTAAQDKKILTPELAKFTERTGVKVNLEVLTWGTAYSKILGAITSHDGPDVLDIGNTWSASLQATGGLLPFDDAAIAALGGKDRFLAPSLTATGAPGQPPTSMPLFGQAYGLFYNKAMFAAAGISEPPATWAQFVADAKKLTQPGHWGVSVLGQSSTVNAHMAFMLGRQHGSQLFDAAGKANFDTPTERAAVKSYLELMDVEHVANPSNAEYASIDFLSDLVHGKAAMAIYQSSARAYFSSMDFDYGVAPLPVLAPLPAAGASVQSITAGSNISIMKDTDNRAAALDLVQFLTSDAEQVTLNKAYGTLPVVHGAYTDPAFTDPTSQMFGTILGQHSQTMPMIAQEAQMETVLGGALNDLWAQAATGVVSDDDVAAALRKATQQMNAGR